MIIKADDNCIGKKRTLQTGCGTLHCEAFFDPDTGDLLETYLSKGSKGGCLNSLTGLSRLISLSARAGVDIYSIVDQLNHLVLVLHMQLGQQQNMIQVQVVVVL